MSVKPPVVSVLMPVYNGADFVETSVSSILAQTFKDFELIIADDGSTDKTPDILNQLANKDRRIRLIRNNKCEGISTILNYAATFAQGMLFARMDADDWASQSRLELQVSTFHQNKKLVLCGSNVTHVDEHMRRIFHTVLPLSDWDIRCTALFENPFAHPSIMMCANAFRRVGGYNQSLSTTQDYELWIRLFDQGEVCNLSSPLIKMRRHVQSVSSRMRLEQLDRTAEIQDNYAAQWIGLVDWDVSRYRNISQRLYSGLPSRSLDQPSRVRTIPDALAILKRLKKRYPNKDNIWITSYVVGRCIWSAFRMPRELDNIVQVIDLIVRQPIVSTRGVLRLFIAALRRHIPH